MEPTGIILIVDDNEDFLESNRFMLEAFDYCVYTARDGKEAVSRALEVKPDLMILDIMMTYETEGFAVAREVRARPELRDMKILMVSGIASEKKLSGMPDPDRQWLPVERVLEKPIEPSALMAEIRKCMKTPSEGGGA
mgnify:CR=1 FL=1